MCDTIAVKRPEGVLFAKNSDRDPNESQILEWHPRRTYDPGATVDCTHITIPQVERTWATLLSRPFWMWGAEMGTNEHGVTIGNEAVFTNQPYAKRGLTGMDLIRLALERADTAAGAVAIIKDLLETHGQGGGAGYEHPDFTYHNSFIVADPASAYVLETAGKLVAIEAITEGVRSISNGLTIPGFAGAYRDRLRTRVAGCDVRIELTTRLGSGASGAADLMAVLRSHGAGRWPRYNLINGTLHMPCMHGGGVVAGSLSTASWVADLTPGGIRHWVTGTSSPCVGIFKPVAVDRPVDLGPVPGGEFNDTSMWWRHERFARAVLADPERLDEAYFAERDRIEKGWIEDPPPSAAAFDTAAQLLEKWSPGLEASQHRDVRPFWMRAYWAKRDRLAGI